MGEPSGALLALHEATDLSRIEFDRLHAERTRHRTPAERETSINVDPEYALDVDSADDGKGFRVKLGISMGLGVGTVDVEAVAYYDVENFAGELTVPLMVEYSNEVAVMALLPYLRHAIADLTQRVFGPPLLMPVVNRGELTFSANPETESDEPKHPAS